VSRPTRETAAGRAYLDLQNQARRQGRGTQELLTMYVVERWLARLSRSPHVNDFVLKGGMLLAAFGSRRPTVDADALAQNMNADQETVRQRVTQIASIEDPDDGVEYLTGTAATTVIRDDALYSGVRVTMTARIATAQVKLRLDINFGDPVTPGPQLIDLPALRPGAEAIRILGYPVETVLAEKLTTAIELGPASTRVRDYADIFVLTGTQNLRWASVRAALLATAGFRQVPLRPLSEAIQDLVSLRARTYSAYRRGLGPDAEHLPEQFEQVVAAVTAFADPMIKDNDPGSAWNRDTAAGKADPLDTRMPASTGYRTQAQAVSIVSTRVFARAKIGTRTPPLLRTAASLALGRAHQPDTSRPLRLPRAGNRTIRTRRETRSPKFLPIRRQLPSRA
jgi:hypothetical protein